MLLSLFVTCEIALATVHLLALGPRLRSSSRLLGMLLTVVVVAGACRNGNSAAPDGAHRGADEGTSP